MASGILAHTLTIGALERMDPTVFSAMRTLEILMAFALQVTIMEEEPSIHGVIGALMVVVAVVLMPFERKWLLTPSMLPGKNKD